MKLRVRKPPIRVAGFSFAGVASGMKPSGALDVGLIVSDSPAIVASAFTRNRVVAPTVLVAREHARRGRARAILVNSGIANACTGQRGLANARAGCAEAARRLGVMPREVLPCSTGKIGVQIPLPRFRKGVRAACESLSPAGFWRATEAISTTDAFPKGGVRTLEVGGRTVTIALMAKGAGMIAPDMATLLVFALTDARIGSGALRSALRAALAVSFNAITVDGDMSTNDTTLALANGLAGNRSIVGGSSAHRRFTTALSEVMAEVARMVVCDGEGATRCVEIVVTGARSEADARRVARAIAGSTLTKAAFFGGDPNWGRILCAAGYSGAVVDPARCRLSIGGVEVARGGQGCGNLSRAARAMRSPEFRVVLDLGQGGATAQVLTSDLSVSYLRFNSEYST